ncbi:MAG: HlyD family efflux transporter periplasmic adaptor subunit [Notoacmeibacter sp.]|nr:HlyD family efflux transporter periplasmic adaptor subunit [Notoacmeibacter sp.]
MNGRAIRILTTLFAVAAMAGAFWWAFRPRPVPVDMADVARGPLAVTIREDGRTRVREIYRVSAPVAGHVGRSLLEVGDPVKAGETVVATINPVQPAIIDERTRAEARARVDAARAAIAVAEAQAKSAKAALALAQSDFERARQLAAARTVSQSTLETARIDVEVKQAALASAEAQIALRNSELASARAALIQPGDKVLAEPEDKCCFEVRAPANGVVLSLAVKSEQVVPAGAELAEIGDPSQLEIVADLLSSDTAMIRPGTQAMVSGFGSEPVAATVRRIDPAGFTKVSALGVEEQRVNAVLDLARAEPSLGHGFAVTVALTSWSADDVLKVPLAALFRTGGGWSAFRVTDGKAVLTAVTVGHLNDEAAEVLSGLTEGDRLVVWPGDSVKDGVEVMEREN